MIKDTNFSSGVALAICSSVCWSFTAVSFVRAIQKLGASAVNVYRLLLASIIFSVFVIIEKIAFKTPIDVIPNLNACIWLSLSALVGLIIGDNLYLKSLVHIGPRRTTQLLTIAPVVSLLLAWVLFGEKIGNAALIGVLVIVCGLLMLIISEQKSYVQRNREPGIFSLKGYIFATLAATCHGAGGAFARKAFIVAPEMGALNATALRIGIAALLMLSIVLILGKGQTIFKQFLFDKPTLSSLLGGTISGPVIGMLCYIAAFKSAPAGIVSALSGLSPLLVIPIMVIKYKMRVSLQIVIGTCITILGVFLISLLK